MDESGQSRREGVQREVRIELHDGVLAAELALPPGATALVVFPRTDGSDREIAHALRESGLGTLLCCGVDAPAAGDLLQVTSWLAHEPTLRRLHIGYFTRGTGTAAAFEAAAREDSRVRAIVCCGGAREIGCRRLAAVDAATLLIVGNRMVAREEEAYERMKCVKRLVVVPAAEAFDEPEAIAEAAALAAGWFLGHLEAAARA